MNEEATENREVKADIKGKESCNKRKGRGRDVLYQEAVHPTYDVPTLTTPSHYVHFHGNGNGNVPLPSPSMAHESVSGRDDL
jgi:hypothetical protein